jgi:cell division initiation protein
MALSPLEIRNQEFTKAAFGYKTSDVKLFLGQVAEGVAELNREKDNLSRRLDGLMKRIGELESQSSAIGQALELAKKEGEQIIAHAEEEASKIGEKADAEAQRIISQYSVQMNETKQQLYELTTIKDAYFRKLLRVLELQEEALIKFDKEYEARRVNKTVSELPMDSRVEFPIPDTEAFSNSVHRRRREALFED